VKKGDYNYFVHPLSDGIRKISPDLLRETTDRLEKELLEFTDIDILLTAEAMGIPVTTTLSMRTGIPFSIVRKRSYGLEGEITILQETGYSKTELHLNLPKDSGRLMMIDDVLSTGGTLKAMVKGIRSTEWEPVGAIILFNKMGERRDELAQELGIEIITLLDVEYIDGSFVPR
jgi:adenine phosphoribosyltransferase